MDQSRHLIFTGNPGTGKTTVARLLAQIYRTLGVVERGHLVETDRAGLVAGYVGQTAPLVQARFDEADEGVLLIDEAYSLVRGGERDFGREAIDTIVKLIEDRRDRIVVVMAGYPDEMEELDRLQPRAAVALPEGDPLPRLHHRRAARDHRHRWPRRAATASTRAPGRGPDLARLDHPRQGLRQRPHRPQPVRARGVDPGHAAGAGRRRPPTSSSPRSSPRTSPRPAKGRSPSSDRPGRSDRAAGAGGPRARWAWSSRPCVVRNAIDDDDDGGDGDGDGAAVVVCADRPGRRVPRRSATTSRCGSRTPAATAAALADGTLADDVDAWVTTTAWLEVVDSRAPDALGDARRARHLARGRRHRARPVRGDRRPVRRRRRVAVPRRRAPAPTGPTSATARTPSGGS